MLAAAARSAGSQGDDLLGFVSRHALPGLLVAIATAIVGFVAAGNIKVSQPKLAALQARLRALDAHAKAVLLTSRARSRCRRRSRAGSRPTCRRGLRVNEFGFGPLPTGNRLVALEDSP